ncbi:MAG: EAL domain-containing protein [Nitrospinae bacterium]|nr:EAL domain-containing protein [Nitrospinota bacterium]
MNKVFNKKPTILIIADNDKEKQLLEKALSMKDYSIHTSDIKGEYSNNVKDIKPDLILLDVAKEVAGKVCKEIKTNAKDIPIFCMTGNSADEISQALKFGATDYITRPFHKEGLRSRLQSYIALKLDRDMLCDINLIINQQKEELEKEYKKVEEELQYTEQNLGSILNTIWEGIVAINTSSIISFVNEELCKIFGYTAKELVGNSITMLMPESYRKKHRDAVKTLIKTGKSEIISNRIELEALHKNKTVFPIEVKVEALHDNKGDLMFTGAVRDISDRKFNEAKVRHLAYYDNLTGLPNKILFNEKLSNAIIKSETENDLLTVMFLDLENFKTINESLGHSIGDELLQDVAIRLQSCLSKGDTLARLGGDDFTILLPDIHHEDDAIAIAEKMLKRLRMVFEIDNKSLFITASIGIALFPFDGENVDSIMKNADAAMYQAKKKGGNRYEVCSPILNARAYERIMVENELRQAIKNREFTLFYQPKVNLTTGAIIGAESLIRWQHPEKGLVSPAYFIEIAEETGLIQEIGDWILEEACSHARTFIDNGIGEFSLAVNISSLQFQPTLVADINNLLIKNKLNNSQLEIEITESMMMESTEMSKQILQELSDFGIKVSIDDFGTGYSSLSYLKLFSIDTLKIDKSFIDDVATNKSDAAIVNTIISMAKNLGFKVVAEGVENKDQLKFLIDHGCDILQGYLFSPPVKSDTLLEMLKNNIKLDLRD